MFHHLLLSYADVFASSTADLGRMDKLVHHIHTGDAMPVQQPVHRIPPQCRGELSKLLSECWRGELLSHQQAHGHHRLSWCKRNMELRYFV